MFVAIICGECGVGEYGPNSSPYGWLYKCRHCGHEVSPCDIQLDPGETLCEVDLMLGYVSGDTPKQ